MKAWKIILVGIIAILLFAVITVVSIISSAGLQTALVNRLLPPLVSVEKAHLGFRGLTLENLRFQEGETLFLTERIRADFPLIRTIRTRQFDIRELAIEGVLLDLREWTPTPREEKEPRRPEDPRTPPPADSDRPAGPFEGILAALPAWPEFSIETFRFNGRILLPGGEEEFSFAASSDNLSSAEELSLQLTGEYRSEKADTFFQEISLTPELALVFDPQRRLTSVRTDIPATILLALEEGIETHQLRVHAEINYSPENREETYLAYLTHSLAGTESRELAKLSGNYLQERNLVQSDWQLAFHSAETGELLRPWLQGSEILADGEGTFLFEPPADRAELVYRLQMVASDLPNLDPRFEASPQLRLDSAGKFLVSAGENKIEAFHLLLDDPILEKPLLSANAHQPFGINPEDFSPILTNPDEPIFSLEILDLPGALLNAFLADFDLNLGEVGGEFSLEYDEGFYALQTLSPLRIHILHLTSPDGEKFLENVEVVANPLFQGTPAGWQVGWNSLELWEGDHALVQSEANLLLPPEAGGAFQGQLEWTLDLPRTLAQPLGEPFRNLRQGQGQGNLQFRATEETINGEMRISLTDLALRRGRETLEAVSLESDFVIPSRDEAFAFEIPLHLLSGDLRSELDFDGTLALTPSPWIEATLEGEELAAQPLQFLAKAFSNPDYEAPDPSPEPDEVPLWSPWQADVKVSLGKVSGWGGPDLENLFAHAEVGENKARLTEFRTEIAGTTAQATGQLVFRPENENMPYALEGDFTLPDFSFATWSRQRQPDRTPLLEGLLTFGAATKAEGPNLSFLADRATGEFSLEARDVVVRAFGRDRASGTMDTLSAVGQIGSLLTGRRELETINILTSYFRRLEIDELFLQAERAEDLSFQLSNLLLRNQDLFLEGRGHIPYEEGQTLWQMPLNLSFDMAVGPALSSVFEQLNLLKPKGEPAPMENFRSLNRSFTIGGTVGDPDPRPMWRTLIDAATNRLLQRDSKEPGEDEKKEERSEGFRLPSFPGFDR
ncbi:MAG: hypothetical protein LAT55_04600 [Opitutales bacterium]|nr:hypothetical protein [Opitutales bacterium]